MIVPTSEPACLGQQIDEFSDGFEDPTGDVDEGVYSESLADLVACMQPTRPEIIRGIPAHYALQRCGQALRGRPGALHQVSRATTCISEFWSHSWHTSAWMKLFTTWYLYNSFAATAIGMAGALLGFILTVAGVLPATLPDQAMFTNSQWCTLLGTAFYYAPFLLWRPMHLIFLDIICINQEDAMLKGEALISMGAILKSSDSMLVLWDATWIRRFWCVFELASFLCSRARGSRISQHLRIRPNLMGPVLLTGHAGLCALLLGFPPLLQAFGDTTVAMVSTLCLGLLPCFVCLAHVGRAFCRSLDTLQQQLASFSLMNAKCSCCDANHVDSYTGQRIPCDRDVMLRCIGTWFGSEDVFRDLVRGQLRTAVLQQLTNMGYLYRQLVAACSPIMWLFLDRTAGLTRSSQWSIVVQVVFHALSYWLLLIPSIILLALALAYMLRAKRAGWARDLLCSLVPVAAAACILAGSIAAMISIETFVMARSRVAGRIVATAVWSTYSALLTLSALYIFWRAKTYAIPC